MIAKYFDGKVARAQRVQVVRTASALSIQNADTNEVISQWAFESIKKDPREISEIVLISSDQPRARLEIEASDERNQLMADLQLKAGFSFVFWKKWLIPVMLLTVLISVGIYRSLPVISAAVAGWVPRSQEQKLDDLVRKQISKDLIEIQVPIREKLALVAQTLAGRPGHFQVDVIKWPEENAFVAFGESIYLTRALVCNAKRPDQIIGIMAHEVGHIEHRHIMKQLARSLSLILLLQFGLGDFSQGLMIDPETALLIVERGFSRDMEHEADLFAIETLQKNGQSLDGLVQFFKGDKSLGPLEILSTHPSSIHRTQLFEEAASKSGTLKESLFSQQDLLDLKALCLL